MLTLMSTSISLTQQSIVSPPCNVDDECIALLGSKYECSDLHCIRKHFSYSFSESFGLIMVIIISAITNSGGVGAGTVMVPVFALFFGFSSSDAVHLSRLTIFCGAFLNFLINWNKRNSLEPNKLLIDYNLSSVMIPLHLAGAEIGVIFGKYLPSLFVTVLLFIFLLISIRKTYERSLIESNSEKKEKVEEIVKETVPRVQEETNIMDEEGEGQENGESPVKTNQSQSLEMDHEKPQENNRKLYDWVITTETLVKNHYRNFLIFGISFFVVTASALLRGGDGRPSIIGLPNCSEETWKIIAHSQGINIVLAFLGFLLNRSEMEKESRDRLTTVEDRQLRLKLLLAAYLTGIAAGVVGVGGGMVLSILMLSIGMEVGSAGALSLFAVLFSSSSTTIQSVIAGGIHLRHCTPLVSMSFIGATLGIFVVKRLIERLAKPSIILWVLLVVLAIAFVLIPLQAVSGMYRNPNSILAFGTLC